MTDREMFLKEATKLLKMARNALEEAEEYLEDVVSDEEVRDDIREAQAAVARASRNLEKVTA